MSILKDLKTCDVWSTVSQVQDEVQWLADRTKGIGGSDIGAICGVNLYSSARQVYLSKVGMYEDSIAPSGAAVERMRFGHLLEPIVADEYARRTGDKLCTCPAILIHREHKFALANVDRFILDDDGKPIGVLECKTTGAFNKDAWDEADIPISYLYQLQWYLFVTGLSVGAIACLVGGNTFYHYRVERNDELINNVLIPKAKDFWYNNVAKLCAPDLSANDTEYVNEKYTDVAKNKEVFFEDSVTDDLACTVAQCKRNIKELEKTMEAAQNRIKELLQDSELGYTKNYIIKWSPRKQTRVDTDALKSRFPDVYLQCQKVIQFRVMTIKGGVDND